MTNAEAIEVWILSALFVIVFWAIVFTLLH